MPRKSPLFAVSGLNRGLFLASLALVLSACAATPPEPSLKPQMPARYAQAQDGWQPVQTSLSSVVIAKDWWRIFHDPVLDQLEDQVAVHNQSLAAQLAAYDQSRAIMSQTQAGFYPTVSSGVSATRSKSNGLGTNGSRVLNTMSVTADASWAPDLWGRVRLQVQAGEATVAASAATLQYTQLSLQGQCAQSYLQLRSVDAQIRLAQENVAAYQRALQITENRYKAGVDTVADVAQARTQLLQARTSLTDFGVTRVQLQNAIAVLVGQVASGFSLKATQDLPAVPAVPAGVPAQLLQRRPDLVATQAQVAAANAQIGVAQTAWFPNLMLSAQGGSQSNRLADLFSAPSLFWSLGPSLAMTLFDGGLRQAQEDASKAAYRQTVANYRQAVLTALQQVEDNLAAQRILAAEAKQQADVVLASKESLRLAMNQYKAGMTPYLNVITAQTIEASAANTELLLLNRRYATAVALIQSLGGGYEKSSDSK